MKRYFIQISYKGTNFCGWQYQPNAKTIQEELQNALNLVFRNNLELTGAGRTDTGVHAKFYAAHFDTDIVFDTEKTVKQLNGILNKDIAVQKIFEVENNVNSRFDALSRTYEYHVHFSKNPFISEYSAFLNFKPDIEKMNSAATILFEFQDFTSFSKLHTDVKTNNCRIYRAEWIELSDKMIFTIEADRFLRNMVRAIVGTLLEVGKTKISEQEFRNIIELKDRGKAGMSVPAQGLFLTNIKYPENIDKQFLRLS